MAAAASASTAVSNTSSTNSFAKPLNAKRRRECIAVKESYLEFFNISSFKKGWAKPLLHLEDVEEAFDLAAEIVVRVRRELDQSGASHKQRNLRLTTGAAREFLHQVESKPQEDLDAFVRNLVYATFKDASGFVEGLSQQSLDKWISEAMAMRATAERTKSRDVAQQLRSLATSISQKLHALTDQPLTDERIEKVSREHLLNLHRLLKMLRSVDSELDIVTAHADDKNVPAVATEKTEGKVATESVATPAGEENKAPETMEVVSEAKESKESKDAPATAASPAEAKSFEEKRAETHDAKTEAASQDTAQPAATEPVETPASGTDASGGSSSDSEVKSRVLPHTVADEAHMLQIKKVQEEFDSLRHDALDLAAEADRLRPEQFRDDSEAGIRKLDQMQRRCMELAHHLMKELLTLDDMVGMSAESRPARKAQVERIQQTLDDVELLQRKISGMISQVREEEAKSKRVPKLKVMAAKAADEAKAAEAKRRDEEELARKKLEEERERKEREEMEARERARVEAAMKAKAEKSALASVEKKQRDTDVAAAASQQEAEESDDESADAGEAKKARQAVGGLWRKLRLRPEFESKEHGDAFTITSYIPGMRQEDIELNLGPNGASLEIKGCRYPSAQEEVIMRRQLLQLRRSQAHGMYYPPQDSDENALLRMGAGRYGAFAQAFTLPKGIDVSKISASYEGGVLRVVIPKIPQPRRRPAYDPYAAAYGNPRRSFLDADDMWW